MRGRGTNSLKADSARARLSSPLTAASLCVSGDQPPDHPAPGRGEHRDQRDEDQPPGDGGGRLAAVRGRSRDLRQNHGR